MNNEKHISSELIAAFLDGNATASENLEILQALGESAELREIMRISMEVDADLGLSASEAEVLPLSAIAASCGEENCCSIECEKYILSRRGIPFDERELISNALKNKWLTEEGTALHNVGRHLEAHGLHVERRFNCTLDDIVSALSSGAALIAGVDGGELISFGPQELSEDICIGPIPDHTVVILAYDSGTITIFDPDSPNPRDEYPLAQFTEAWADSKNYLVTIANGIMD